MSCTCRHPGPPTPAIRGRRNTRRRQVRDQTSASQDDDWPLDAGIPARWAAGDEVYGAPIQDCALQLQARRVGYVLAIGCDRRVPTAADPQRADTVATSLPEGVWQRISAGAGAKGQRYYDWAWVGLTAESEHHWLLVRRHPHHGELAFYRCYAPQPGTAG